MDANNYLTKLSVSVSLRAVRNSSSRVSCQNQSLAFLPVCYGILLRFSCIYCRYIYITYTWIFSRNYGIQSHSISSTTVLGSSCRLTKVTMCLWTYALNIVCPSYSHVFSPTVFLLVTQATNHCITIYSTCSLTLRLLYLYRQYVYWHTKRHSRLFHVFLGTSCSKANNFLSKRTFTYPSFVFTECSRFSS